MADPAGRAGQTVREVLAAARVRLEQAGIETAALDARVLFEYILAKPHAWFYANSDVVVPQTDLARFDDLLARREEREPISQIVGNREFWSLLFEVTGDVLTPRPDSESLVEGVLEHLPDRTKTYRFLDLGTGSGCLLLTLLSEYSAASGVGIDVSPAALQVASRNGARLHLDARVDWMLGSWETKLDADFDVVISNPPYIESAALVTLDRDVVDYDPHLALDGGADGLDAYRAILANVSSLMAENGVVVFEIGEGQADAITILAKANGLQLRSSRDDLSGITRVLVFQHETIE